MHYIWMVHIMHCLVLCCNKKKLYYAYLELFVVERWSILTADMTTLNSFVVDVDYIVCAQLEASPNHHHDVIYILLNHDLNKLMMLKEVCSTHPSSQFWQIFESMLRLKYYWENTYSQKPIGQLEKKKNIITK